VKKIVIPTLIGISSGLLIYILTTIFLYTYYPLELKTFDLRTFLKTSKHQSERIVIIDIDDYSIKKLGRFRNWPRLYYATVIDYLTEEKATVIAADLMFPEPDSLSRSMIQLYQQNKKEAVKKDLKEAGLSTNSKKVLEIVLKNIGFDKELMNSIQESERVVLPLAINKSSKVLEGDVKGIRKFSLKFPFITRSSFSAGDGIAAPTKKLLRGVKGIGVVNTDSDLDGIIRRIPLFYRFRKQVYPSFALSIFLQTSRLNGEDIEVVPGKYASFGDYKIPIDSHSRMMINFLGVPFSFRYISFYDVLMKRVGTGFFKDKIVLIGSSAVALSDLKPTPVSGNLMPGVEIHANGIYTLINKCFIHYPSVPITLILIVGISIIISLFTSNIRPWVSLVLTIIIFIGFLTACDILFDINNLWFEVVRPSYALILSYIAALGYRYATVEKSKKEMRMMFDRYVSKEVVEKIITNPHQLKLGGDRKDITVLFADIRGFTSMSESMEPEEVVGILNDYLSIMTDIILSCGGTIDKFIGDAIMAVFGAPIAYEDHPLRAAKAALKMRRALKDLHLKWEKENRQIFDIGIGISSGIAIVGNIGSIRRTEYTAIGDIVNLGARIEPLNKQFNTHILIAESVFERIKERVNTEEIGSVKVRGKKKEVKLYELKGMKEE
jgi:adenylate cyclase